MYIYNITVYTLHQLGRYWYSLHGDWRMANLLDHVKTMGRNSAASTVMCCQWQWQKCLLPTVPEPGQSQGRARARRRRRRPGQAEAVKYQLGLGVWGRCKPRRAPETKHKPVMGAITVFACAFLHYLWLYAYVKCTLMYAYVDTPAMWCCIFRGILGTWFGPTQLPGGRVGGRGFTVH